MEANVVGFPLGWKDMLRDSRGDGINLYGILTEFSCIRIFWFTVVNVHISASAIHFRNMRQRMLNHFAIAVKIRASVHHL